ncbi:hypothetical protein ACSFC1_10875 [Pseudothermotoga sp. U03pept]|uniref:hypothetical protein n=1 Tax=Pseudothermotoga sp. U03pept TaxID=3447012 RepID=UPI003F0225FF
MYFQFARVVQSLRPLSHTNQSMTYDCEPIEFLTVGIESVPNSFESTFDHEVFVTLYNHLVSQEIG